MVRQSSPIVAALLACLVVVAGCGGGPPGQTNAEIACRARGLLPGTAEFTACLHPNEAAAVERGEAAWQEMNNDVEE
jgi:hypothetical protein